MIVPTIVRSQMAVAKYRRVHHRLSLSGQRPGIRDRDYRLLRTRPNFEKQTREALTFKEGDTLVRTDKRAAALTESEDRLAKLPGVTRARINVVCREQGRIIVYVGVEERGASTMPFRAAPTRSARLEADIVRSGEDFFTALMRAVERGEAAEDRSQGHAFTHDPATRAIQERFVTYANGDLGQLRLVLQSSDDATHRALAALVLGYAPEKQPVSGSRPRNQ